MDLMNSYGEVFWPWPDEQPGVVPDLARQRGAERGDSTAVEARSLLQPTAAGTAPTELLVVVDPEAQRRRLSDILQAWAWLCRQCSVNVIEAQQRPGGDGTRRSEGTTSLSPRVTFVLVLVVALALGRNYGPRTLAIEVAKVQAEGGRGR
eukprot:7659246-Heterocapsa_arctica.AAC.1